MMDLLWILERLDLLCIGLFSFFAKISQRGSIKSSEEQDDRVYLRAFQISLPKIHYNIVTIIILNSYNFTA